MKKYLPYLLIFILNLTATSCEEEKDFGYPSAISLSGVGETVKLAGSKNYPPIIDFIEILDYNGDGNAAHASEDEGSLTVTTQWLTVESSLTENKITLTAEPNGTSKKRKLYLYLHFANSRQEITVAQSK